MDYYDAVSNNFFRIEKMAIKSLGSTTSVKTDNKIGTSLIAQKSYFTTNYIANDFEEDLFNSELQTYQIQLMQEKQLLSYMFIIILTIQV